MRKMVLILLFIFALVFSTACNEETQPQSTKKIITFGYTGYCNYDAEIAHFNSSQDTYEIQLKHYIPNGDAYIGDINGAGSSDECSAQLIEDLKSGNGPDIIDLTSFSLSVRELELQIYLEDLYPYIDADAELSRTDLIKTILDAYEVDGALYSTVNELSIFTTAVSASVTQAANWNIGMLEDTTVSIAESNKLSYIAKDRDILFCDMINAFIYDFVNPDLRYANFKCDEYRKLLEICDKIGDAHYSGMEVNENGVLYTDYIRSFYYPQLFETVFQDDFVFANNLDGTVASYWDEPFEKLAMNNTSKNKEGVWVFLRMFLTEDYQIANSIFPSNLGALEYQLKTAQDGILEMTIDSKVTGGQLSRDYKPSTSFDSSHINYVPVSDEQINIIMDLINDTTRMYSTEYIAYIETARRVAQQYFDDEIDLYTAVEMTQQQIAEMLE